MKKIVLIGMAFLCIFCLANSVYATNINMDISSKEVKPGETITLRISVKDIDIEEGINTIQGRLKYDKNIFEKVGNQDIKSVNDWNVAYNDEDTDAEGKFVILKLAAGVKADEDMIEINFKVKDSAKRAKTSIELQELATVENDDIVDIDSSKVDVKVRREFSIIKSFWEWLKGLFNK